MKNIPAYHVNPWRRSCWMTAVRFFNTSLLYVNALSDDTGSMAAIFLSS
ncbi:MAG: hypothetical protein LUF87_06845 [Alistipes sp.]|nr:hypothetical protein [Alistipes sp.]